LIPRIATVLSAREWESGLVASAHDTARVRLVARIYQPDDVRDIDGAIDAIVVGAETPWLTTSIIHSWTGQGIVVVGMYPIGDPVAPGQLAAMGVDVIIEDTEEPEVILHRLRIALPDTLVSPVAVGSITVITGPRGAPGITEVSVALATLSARRRETILVDLDQTDPAIAIRLNLRPEPTIEDAIDLIHAGQPISSAIQQFSEFGVIAGAGNTKYLADSAAPLVEGVAAHTDHVVVDAGPNPLATITKRADEAIIVCDASAVGIVRAARFVAAWSGPQPQLVVNRVPKRDTNHVIDAVRKWTGITPGVLVPDNPGIRDRARHAQGSHKALLRALDAVVPA
jgi:MinD-like ATPase involved in chromosome partitioning or flagellar assembly